MSGDFFYLTFGEEIHELSRSLGEAPNRVGAGAAQVVRRSTQNIIRGAKIDSPVDTGTNRASIGADITGDGRSESITSEIGPTTNYGGYLELGTSKMPPRPYLGPAFDAEAPGFLSALGSVVGEI